LQAINHHHNNNSSRFCSTSLSLSSSIYIYIQSPDYCYSLICRLSRIPGNHSTLPPLKSRTRLKDWWSFYAHIVTFNNNITIVTCHFVMPVYRTLLSRIIGIWWVVKTIQPLYASTPTKAVPDKCSGVVLYRELLK